MSQSRDKKPPHPTDDADAKTGGSGRVGFDSRGNSVWEWQVQTGVYSTDVDTTHLRKLDLEDLSIEDSAVRRLEAEKDAKPKPEKTTLRLDDQQGKFDPSKAGGGFNPYDNSNRTAGKPAAATAPKRPLPAAAAKPKSSDVRKLSSWVRLKRALTGGKDED